MESPAPTRSTSNPKCNNPSDGETERTFLTSWKSMSLGKDALDFSFDAISTTKRELSRFDKLDMDFNMEDGFGKFSSFKADIPDLDFSSPSHKTTSNVERCKVGSSSGSCQEKNDCFTFSFDFNELDNFNVDMSLLGAKKNSANPNTDIGVSAELHHDENHGMVVGDAVGDRNVKEEGLTNSLTHSGNERYSPTLTNLEDVIQAGTTVASTVKESNKVEQSLSREVPSEQDPADRCFQQVDGNLPFEKICLGLQVNPVPIKEKNGCDIEADTDCSRESVNPSNPSLDGLQKEAEPILRGPDNTSTPARKDAMRTAVLCKAKKSPGLLVSDAFPPPSSVGDEETILLKQESTVDSPSSSASVGIESRLSCPLSATLSSPDVLNAVATMCSNCPPTFVKEKLGVADAIMRKSPLGSMEKSHSNLAPDKSKLLKTQKNVRSFLGIGLKAKPDTTDENKSSAQICVTTRTAVTSAAHLQTSTMGSSERVKTQKIPEFSALSISRKSAPKAHHEPSNAHVNNINPEESPLAQDLHHPEKDNNIANPGVASLKRKASNIDRTPFTSLKRLVQSPTKIGKEPSAGTSNQNVEESKSDDAMIACAEPEISQVPSIKELEFSFSLEDDGVVEKAKTCTKDLEDVCGMLKKKVDEAKELLVRAVVNNNKLLMISHPMFEQKIHKVQKFAARLVSTKPHSGPGETITG